MAQHCAERQTAPVSWGGLLQVRGQRDGAGPAGCAGQEAGGGGPERAATPPKAAEAWHSSLSPEERAVARHRARNESYKKYCKSDESRKNPPEVKTEFCRQILAMFFDEEAEDDKKDDAARKPDYEALQKCVGEKKMDFRHENKIIEEIRDADCRYHVAMMHKKCCKSEGSKKNPSGGKMEFLEQIVAKFFDVDAEDDNKAVAARMPDYAGLQKRAGEKKMDYSHESKSIEASADADCRHHLAVMIMQDRAVIVDGRCESTGSATVAGRLLAPELPGGA